MEARVRTDGKNVALSLLVPFDRSADYTISTRRIAQKDPLVRDQLQHFEPLRDANFFMNIKREPDGRLSVLPSVDDLELVQPDSQNGEKTVKLEKDRRYMLDSNNMLGSRIRLRGDGERIMSIRIRNTPESKLTERENLLIDNNPEVRRLHNVG